MLHNTLSVAASALLKASIPLSTFLIMLLCSTVYGDSNENANDWAKDPVLKSVSSLAQDIMREYQDWSEAWGKRNGKPTEEDKTINRMADSFVVSLIHILGKAPNPPLAAQWVRFLDTHVPPEFDHDWRFAFIEISNVAMDADALQHEENLLNRSMKKSTSVPK